MADALREPKELALLALDGTVDKVHLVPALANGRTCALLAVLTGAGLLAISTQPGAQDRPQNSRTRRACVSGSETRSS